MADHDFSRHGRRSIRLRGYDYSQAGAYFVNFCVQNRLCPFGDVVDGEMRLNAAGRMVDRQWQDLSSRFPFVELDEYLFMPNHVHGIILITGATGRGEPRVRPGGDCRVGRS